MMDEIRVVTPFGLRQIGYERHRSAGLLSSANACKFVPVTFHKLGESSRVQGLAADITPRHSCVSAHRLPMRWAQRSAAPRQRTSCKKILHKTIFSMSLLQKKRDSPACNTLIHLGNPTDPGTQWRDSLRTRVAVGARRRISLSPIVASSSDPSNLLPRIGFSMRCGPQESRLSRTAPIRPPVPGAKA